jgi:hypothetical protein
VVVVFPEPLPTNSAAFLPYLAAEIVKTYAAFGSGTTARLAIPGDVQLLVDQADVSLEDVTALGTIAEDAVIDEKVKRLRGRESRIPGPSEVTRSLSALEKFTAGELDNEEYATRLSEQMSVTILPISQGKPLSWQGELPIKPNRDQVVELLGYTIPVSGHLAGKVYKALDANDVAFRRGLFAHRLLAEIVVVDLDHTDIMTLDEFQGLLAQ